ncbi:MAG: sigma-70 family RNA polymerase sigma factor [Planctomycetes bacterium]|nr:sigma-70 family RNA polymerase sigma factor [Planctomycetota bacterium]
MSNEQHNAFARLFVSSQHRVYGYIASLLPQADDAEEVFQQTSLILWQKWEAFDLSRDFVAWACGIAHFEVMNFLRRRRPGRVYLSESVMEKLSSDRLADGHEPDRRGEALSACLAKLSDDQRQLIERCYIRSNTINAVAQEMGRTANAVYIALRRIRGLLLECIRRQMSREGA